MSEYLSEDEQLESLRNWWKRYGIWLLIGLIVAAGGYGGWQWYQKHAMDKALEASALYQSWLDSGADEAKQESALAALEAVAKGSAYHSLVLFRQAAKAVEAGELEKAEPLLQKVIDESGEPLLRSLAVLRQAAVLQGLDRSDEALKLLDRVSGDGYKGLALELKGDIHMARGERAEAHKAYAAALATLEGDQKDSLLEAKVNNSAVPPGSDKPADTKSEAPAEAASAPVDEAVSTAVSETTPVVDEVGDATGDAVVDPAVDSEVAPVSPAKSAETDDDQ